ncbi:MAG: aminotransferase class V-fold PLP-dependent enzyme [Planctomycetes bacterium]|nr:aminotransferase class V-fold PLP-dependent enzyme [Planctomycetota bacterium]
MDSTSGGMSRRGLLKAGAGGTVGAVFLGELEMEAFAARSSVSIYEQLGVQPIINAAGTITALGGSLMPPEVIAAWVAAAEEFVDLLELQDRVGERIAQRIGVEAAMVTTGAAGGILLGTAAALTYRDRSLIGGLPLPAAMGMEVLRQPSHRACYDHQVTACGVRLVDVATREELERAISTRTAMMFSYNIHEAESQISRQEWLDVARARGIPTLVDAAADVPPVESLRSFNAAGFDMVVFSGGKALCGPQDAGLLLGRKDLIDAAKRNTSPHCGTIGRALKVSKEDLVAMWVAVERYLKFDHESQRGELEQRMEILEQALNDIPTVSTRRIVPPRANRFPHLLLFWDEQRLGVRYPQMKERLAAGKPSIATARVHGTGEDGFLISVFTLKPGQAEIVAERIRAILLSP